MNTPSANAHLKPTEFYALLSIHAVGHTHAYPLKALLFNNSLGAINIPHNKLYKLLANLHDNGYIEIVGNLPAGPSGERRITYQLSDSGMDLLKSELNRLDHALTIAKTNGLLPTDPSAQDIQIH